MYTVLKKDSTGTAFFLWIKKDTEGYVVKHDFSNLIGFQRESLVRMAYATGAEDANHLSVNELITFIQKNIQFES